MKLKINEDDSNNELEIIINCRQMNEDVLKLIAMLRVLDVKVTGIKDGQTYLLEAEKIYFIDTVDKKTFLYTNKDVYETPLKLYELEEQLSSKGFFRAGKSIIINFNQIKSLRPDIDGKILVTMNNNEKLIVSKQYTVTIKKKLGVI